MKASKYIILLAMITLCTPSFIWAQNSSVRKETRKGNREYKSQHYDRAEVNYRRALHEDSTAYRAQYNLANTLYRQKKYDDAIQHYNHALSQPVLNDKERSNCLHNRGNCYLKTGLAKENRAEGLQQFQQAVNDYQEALKLSPKNDDTRYNLSYAKKMLQQAQQQQQQQNGNQNQDKKNDKDNKDKQGNNNQDNQQDKGDKQDQQNQQPQNQQDRQQQKKQQRQQQQKKQDAERLLEAVKNNEKNTMKENAKKVEVAAPRNIEKDW